MHQTIYPALACAITAALAGGCGLTYVGSRSREGTHIVLTAIFATIAAMGLSGGALLVTL